MQPTLPLFQLTAGHEAMQAAALFGDLPDQMQI